MAAGDFNSVSNVLFSPQRGKAWPAYGQEAIQGDPRTQGEMIPGRELPEEVWLSLGSAISSQPPQVVHTGKCVPVVCS